QFLQEPGQRNAHGAQRDLLARARSPLRQGHSPRQCKPRDINHERVVKRVRRIGSAMIVWIAELRGNRPNYRPDTCLPERRMIAALQVSKQPLNPQIGLESQHWKVRNIASSEPREAFSNFV